MRGGLAEELGRGGSFCGSVGRDSRREARVASSAMRPTFLGPMLLLVSASCGSARSDPYRASSSDVPEDATQNPCLTVEGMGCACGVQVGAWRCVGSMPVCVCPTPALDAGIEQDVPREDTPPAQPEDRAIPFQCPAGSTYCESIRACVDTAINANHCGGCDRRCSAGTRCAGGACVVDAGVVTADVHRADVPPDIDLIQHPNCRTQTDCNRTLDDGCEVDTQTNPNHCGNCGIACVGVPSRHVVPACRAGGCVGSCASGWWDCDMSASNGCESDTIAMRLAPVGSCRTAF